VKEQKEKKEKKKRKMNENLKAELEKMHQNAGNAPALKNPDFQKAAKEAQSAMFAPYVVDKKGKSHTLKPLGMNRERYCVDTSKKTRSRVVDETDKVDVDFKGATLMEETGTPYYSEKHGEPMRVMKTDDGSLVSFPQSAIVPLHRRTRRSYAIGSGMSDERFSRIFKSRRAKN